MKVFLVEDAMPIRQRIKSMVESAGAEVVGEASAEAEAILGLECCPADLVIIDLRLAEGSGVEVIRYLSKACPKTRVVVMTNYSDEQFRSICMQYGADFFLDKSSEFLVLRDLVNSFSQSQRTQ